MKPKIEVYKPGYLQWNTNKLTVNNNYANIGITEENLNLVKFRLKELFANKVEDGDIVCFGKDNITRDKLKQFSEKVKFTRVTDISKANTIVIDDIGFFNSITPDLKTKYILNHSVSIKYSNKPSYVNIISDVVLDDNYLDQIKKTNHTYTSINLYSIGSYYSYNETDVNKYRGSSKIINVFSLLETIYNDNVKIVLASTLQKQFNEDSIELNEETYETLNNMFKSDDLENTKLALEILSNAYISDENKILVALLLYNNHNNITGLVKTNNINKFLKAYNKEYKMGRMSIAEFYGEIMESYSSKKFELMIKIMLLDYINNNLGLKQNKIKDIIL